MDFPFKKVGADIPLLGSAVVGKRWEGVEFNWRDVYPENEKLCPFQPAHVLSEPSGEKKVTVIRIFHPCVKERCQIWKGECGAKGDK